MSEFTVWHNPRCSKSRAALSLLERAGVKPNIVLYLETRPSADSLTEVLLLLNCEPRELMRKGERAYEALGLAAPAKTRSELIQAMVEHPILIERPIVITQGRAIVARPPERVHELL